MAGQWDRIFKLQIPATRRRPADFDPGSSIVTMAIVFYVLFLHVMLVSADRTSLPERQMLSTDNQEKVSIVPVFDPSQPTTSRHNERHFWHRWHKHHKQTEEGSEEPISRLRRWKEVPNGEESPHSDDPMVNRTMGSVLKSENHSSPGHQEENHDEHNGIHVASWRWDEIGIYITFTTFIIVAGLAKVGNKSLLYPNVSNSITYAHLDRMECLSSSKGLIQRVKNEITSLIDSSYGIWDKNL